MNNWGGIELDPSLYKAARDSDSDKRNSETVFSMLIGTWTHHGTLSLSCSALFISHIVILIHFHLLFTFPKTVFGIIY